MARWQLLDYVLVRRRNRQDVVVSKAASDADGWTDHRLVISKMRLRLQPYRGPQGNPHALHTPGKLNIVLLSLSAHRLHFCNRLTQQLEELPSVDENSAMENRRCQLRDFVHSTALAVLGCACCQPQDWFYDNDAALSNLLAGANGLHRAYLDRPTEENKVAFYQCRRLAQQRLREIQDAWMTRKVEEIRE
nr:unnamed protein product [Spirometra erinaceieuropaei]